MTDHESRVLALLDEANPIPPDEVVNQSIPTAAQALAKARSQSGDLAGPGLGRSDRRDDRWSENWPRLALAAGIALLALAAAFLFSRFDDPVQQVDTDRTTTTEPGTTTTTEPEESGRPIEGYWGAISFTLVLEQETYAVVAADHVVDQGTYVATDTTLTLTTGEGSANCAPGDSVELQYAVIESGDADALDLDFGSDDCGFSRGIGVGSASLSRVAAFALPASALDTVRAIGEAPAPGRFFTPTFRPGFQITLANGWDQMSQLDFHMFLLNGSEGLMFHNHNVEDPAAVYQLFDQHPATDVGEPAPIEIGGAPGLTFDYISPEANDLFFVPGFGGTQPPFDYRNRAWVIDVNGSPVTIAYASQPSTFDRRVVAAEKMIASIVWDDLG